MTQTSSHNTIQHLFILFLSALLLNAAPVLAQQVDAGNGHAITLDNQGRVWTVGRNNFGQLGIGSQENQSEPQLLEDLPPIKAISRGYDHSLAIDSTGRLWAWGRNNYGQLGTSILVDRDKPQLVPGHGNFVSVEGGHWHTVGLKGDGSVWAWGHNFYGELGNGQREHTQYPRRVVDERNEPLTGIKHIVSVGYFTLALNEEGKVYAWGSNDFGELGHFDNEIQPYAKLIPDLSDIVEVAVGWHHAVALDKEGRVFVWGSDPATQYAEQTLERFPGITLLPDLPKIKKIACGSWHSLAVDERGDLWAWGKNHVGMLGTGDTTSSRYPVKVESLSGIENIGGGCFQSLAVDTLGEVWTFGNNPSGQQGRSWGGALLKPEKMAFPKSIDFNYAPMEDGLIYPASFFDSPERLLKYGLFILSVLLNCFFLFRMLRSKQNRLKANT